MEVKGEFYFARTICRGIHSNTMFPGCRWPMQMAIFCTIYLDAEAMHFSTWNENGKLNEDTQPLIIQRSGVNIGLKASAVRRNKNKQRHQGKKWKKRTFNLY